MALPPAPLPKMPWIIVLDAVMQTLQAAGLSITLADLLAAMGKDGEPAELLLRWARNRYTTFQERPCIALAFVSDGPRENSDQYMSAGEAERELAIDVIADVELPTEAECEEGLAQDTARLEILSHFVGQALKALKASFIDQAGAPTPLTPVAHWVEDLGIDDDEDLQDENGRLVGRINVLYRVRADDPTILLRQE